MEHLDFKIVVEPKDSQSFTVILVASSRQEKSAWTSDISQARRPESESLQHSDERMLARSLRGTELTNIPSAESVPQCIDNIRCNGLMMNAFEDNSKVTVPQMIKWALFVSSVSFLSSLNDTDITRSHFRRNFPENIRLSSVLSEQIRFESVLWWRGHSLQ